MKPIYLSKSTRKLILAGIFVFLSVNLVAQQYNVAGSAAVFGGPGCYRLTNTTGQAGAVWNIYMINLTQPFDITLTLNFGSNDADNYPSPTCGADGMTFVLQPLNTGMFGSGGGVGFSGINPSIGIIMDTYENGPDDNFTYDQGIDHMSLSKNGSVIHGTTNELVPPSYAASHGFPSNIEDGLNHLFRFTWTPGVSGNGVINVYFGNATTLPAVPTLTYTGNIVANIFSGNPNVYWGVSGSTGGCWNVQTVCMTTVANFSSAASVCEGATASFTSSSVSGLPITSYYWDFGDGGNSTLQNPTYTYAAAGTYNVNLTITNSGGFTSTMTHSLVINPLPAMNITSTVNPLCQGTSSTLTATGASTYVWSGGLGTNPVINITPTVSTIYTVSGTTTAGCTASDTIAITVNPKPVVTASALPTNVCLGSSGTLTANSTVTGTTFSWMPGNLSGSSVTVTPTTATTYTVVGTANGCTGSASVSVGIFPGLTVSVSPLNSSICNGTNVVLTAAGAGTYAWSPSATLSSATGNPVTASPHANTTYTVTGSDSLGCTGTAIANVVVTPGPAITITSTQNNVCPGDSSLLGVAFVAASYSWSPTTALTNPNGQYTTAHPTVTTSYTITANNNGCLSTDEYTLLVNPVPDVSFTADFREGCQGLNVHFQDLSTPNPQSWNWIFGDTASSVNTSHVQNPYFHYSEAGIFDVSLSVEGAGGCTNKITLPGYITVHPLPKAIFDVNPQRTSLLDNHIFFEDKSVHASSWKWYFNDKNPENENSVLQFPSHSYSDTGIYYPVLIAYSGFGCADTTSGVVMIDPDIAFYIPNAFTPGDGGNNPNFKVFGEGIDLSTYEMRIFNRWGQQIYYSRDLEKGWDGRINGNRLGDNGLYNYIVQFNDVLKRYHELKGSVMLIR